MLVTCHVCPELAVGRERFMTQDTLMFPLCLCVMRCLVTEKQNISHDGMRHVKICTDFNKHNNYVTNLTTLQYYVKMVEYKLIQSFHI